MKIDFFKSECLAKTSERKFGIFDAQDSSPAVLKFDEENKWNAIVINNLQKDLLFTAIDNCIEIRTENGETERRCDCMLTYEEKLLLIELKNMRSSWQTDGLSQIEATIKRMITEDFGFFEKYKKRTAIVANRKNQFPAFHVSNFEHREYFMKHYKTRIQFEAEIFIK
jgi:hypothetical protein